jgi:hypothetical protein
MPRNFGFSRKPDPIESIRRADEIDIVLVVLGLAVAIGIIMTANWITL